MQERGGVHNGGWGGGDVIITHLIDVTKDEMKPVCASSWGTKHFSRAWFTVASLLAGSSRRLLVSLSSIASSYGDLASGSCGTSP